MYHMPVTTAATFRIRRLMIGIMTAWEREWWRPEQTDWELWTVRICTGYNEKTGQFTGLTLASQVHMDQLIYWTTSSRGRTWHHRGTVTATAEGHPNRS